MIFYLAALQSISPSLAEAAALEGASRWTFFRRVQFPLLMPTTLFVLVNAVINAFRMVDHIIVMTRGGPDNATTLLLYYIYQVGFNFWDTAYAAALTIVLLALLAARGLRAIRRARTADPLPMSAERPDPYAPSGVWRALESARGRAAGDPVGAAARLRGVGGVSPGRVHHALRAARAADAATTSSAPGRRRRSRATSSTPFVLVTMILACQLVLCTLAAYAFARYDFLGSNVAFALVLAQLMIMPDVLIVENYRTMSRIGLIDTIPAIALPYVASAFGIFLLRQTFKTVPKELDDAARVEGATPLQVLLKVYVPLAQADLRRLRARVGQLSLEQLPLAADRHQLGRGAPAHRRPAGVLLGRPGHRLVDHLRRHADDLGAAAARLPAVPAPVRAELHARGDTVKMPPQRTRMSFAKWAASAARPAETVMEP